MFCFEQSNENLTWPILEVQQIWILSKHILTDIGVLAAKGGSATQPASYSYLNLWCSFHSDELWVT